MKTPKKPPPKDPNKLAFEIVRMSTEEPEPEQTVEPPMERSAISQYLAEIGRKGGLKEGKAWADRLTPEQRTEIAKRAALTRRGKKNK
jgi:hypothetical protein